MSKLRTSCEKQIQQQRIREDTKVEGIRRQANQVFSLLHSIPIHHESSLIQAAEQFLYDQTVGIQNENVELRTQLHGILKQTQSIEQLKQRLEEEQLHLIRQLKLIADLRRIRLDKISTDVTSESTPH